MTTDTYTPPTIGALAPWFGSKQHQHRGRLDRRTGPGGGSPQAAGARAGWHGFQGPAEAVQHRADVADDMVAGFTEGIEAMEPITLRRRVMQTDVGPKSLYFQDGCEAVVMPITVPWAAKLEGVKA